MELHCRKCNEEIDPRRAALGFKVCLDCGEAIAKAEIAHRRKAMMPLHKGNYVFVGSGEAAKQNVLAISQMRRING